MNDCTDQLFRLQQEVRVLRTIRQAELLEIARYERILSELIDKTFPKFPSP